MTEFWRSPGPYDDQVHGTFDHGLAKDVRPRFDRNTWKRLEALVEAASARDREQIDRAMRKAMDLPLSNLIGLKQALRVGIWCALTALQPGPYDRDAVEGVADRIRPSAMTLLKVADNDIVLVVGDALRVMDEDRATYSLHDGEFVIVAAVSLAELVSVAPAPGSDLRAIHDQCDRAFSMRDRDVAQAAWLDSLARPN